MKKVLSFLTLSLSMLALAVYLNHAPRAEAYASGPSLNYPGFTNPVVPAPAIGLQPIVVTATATQLTASQSGALVINSGAGANVTNTLPPTSSSVIGCKFFLQNQAAHNFGVRASTGDKIANGAAISINGPALVDVGTSQIGDTAVLILTAYTAGAGTWTIFTTNSSANAWAVYP